MGDYYPLGKSADDCRYRRCAICATYYGSRKNRETRLCSYPNQPPDRPGRKPVAARQYWVCFEHYCRKWMEEIEPRADCAWNERRISIDDARAGEMVG